MVLFIEQGRLNQKETQIRKKYLTMFINNDAIQDF